MQFLFVFNLFCKTVAEWCLPPTFMKKEILVGVFCKKNMITCSVGVVVALQPCLHTNQIMLVHEEYDILGPVNLIY